MSRFDDASDKFPNSSPLEICLNDHSLNNNTGGYQINISVDQLGPVLP